MATTASKTSSTKAAKSAPPSATKVTAAAKPRKAAATKASPKPPPKTAPTKAAANKALPAKAKAKATTERPVAAESGKRPVVTPDQRRYYVEVAAYYMAERRGFTGGNPAEDWLRAEAEVERLLAEGLINP